MTRLLALALMLELSAPGMRQAPVPGQLPTGSPAPRQPAAPPVPPRGAIPTRDAVAARKGTAVLRGQVIDARTGSPIRRARVTVISPAMSTPVAQTDAEGRFEIRDLVAGKHMIDVAKTGYLSVVASNDGKRPPPVEIGEGQTIEKIVIALAKGGVISGQVLDEFGEPQIGAEMRVMRYRYMDGQRQLMNAPGGSFGVYTDDLGNFRLHSLEPGDYFVAARPRSDGSPFGPAPPNAEGATQTFYPGTANVAEARRVTVRGGRETSGIVFPVAMTRLSRIRGRALTSSGEPFTGSISVAHRDPSSGGSNSTGSGIRADGSFEVVNLQPGTYVVTTRPNSWREGDGSEMGRAVVTVNGEDVDDLVLVGSTGGTARGRIVTDEGGAPPFVVKSFRVMAQPADLRAPDFNRPAVTVREDWTFEMTGLFDRAHLRPENFTTAPGSGSGMWTVKAVLLDGQDVTDSGIDFQSGRTVDGIDIVYTRKVSRLAGQFLDSRGGAAEGWIVLFPADESKWTPRSRYVRGMRSGPAGKYAQSVVPFDDYLIVGVTDIEEGQWADPDFLRVVKPLATSLSIGESENKVVDVKLVDWRK